MVSTSHIPFSSSTLALLFILSALISLNHASRPISPNETPTWLNLLKPNTLLAIPSFLKSGTLSTLSPASDPLSSMSDSEPLASSMNEPDPDSTSAKFNIVPASELLSGISDSEHLASSTQEPKSLTTKFYTLPVSEPMEPASETLAFSTPKPGNYKTDPGVFNPMLPRTCGGKTPCPPKPSPRIDPGEFNPMLPRTCGGKGPCPPKLSSRKLKD